MASADDDPVRALERRLAAAEQARLAAEEEARELRVELARTGERARLAASDGERLLAALAILGEARDPPQLFTDLLPLLRDALELDAAFVVGFEPDAPARVLAATDPEARALTWPCGQLTERVLAGAAVALFDLDEKPEWRQADSALRGEWAAALHLPLSTPRSRAMLVCLDRRRGSFTAERTARARRFAELARHALHKVEQLAGLAADCSVAVELSRAKSSFVASMSHELRTPLNAIVGYCEYLLEDSDAREGPEALDALARIHVSARILCDLIGNILDLSKIEAGRMDVVHDLVAVGETCRAAVIAVDPLAARNHNIIRVDVPLDLPALRSDDAKLRQILINLLANACKFTGRGAVDLVVRPGRAGDRPALLFHVRDTGQGITPEQARAVFLPFTQVGLIDARRAGGTGLGLTIAKYLAELLGGGIELSSVVGVGTTFTVALPLAPRE